ncbi:MAG: hypothetical protein WCR56_05100 [Bacilli bacterium]|jgi:ABC-type transporter Mla subunit MlaD
MKKLKLKDIVLIGIIVAAIIACVLVMVIAFVNYQGTLKVTTGMQIIADLLN